jgi:hypothetical protein
MAGITYMNHQANNPVSGDMRQNVNTNLYEIYNGSSWTPITQGWVEQESLAESVEHVVDKIGSYIEEDHSDNATIQDAYSEWLAATERFRVILTMVEK